MDAVTQVREMVKALARSDGTFGRVVEGQGVSVPRLVREVAAKAERAWKEFAVAGAVGPDTPQEVEQALAQIDTDRALELLTSLAVEDLVFPGHLHRDRTRVHQAADRVVRLLGRQADWYTNISGVSPGLSWSPVTRHTFDGVVAGAGNGITVVLLQVGED
ncbi:hypothetical protein [Streptomyces griseoluteus]|uniref:hypothetical protein n=1 Tax=Streptomyces griseoluteus TaxID=29306 RepID=UPI003678B440